MSKTVSKTFRLPVEVAKQIEVDAVNNNISQAGYITVIVTENKFLKLQKTFMEDVNAMEDNDLYLKEQQELADADFS